MFKETHDIVGFRGSIVIESTFSQLPNLVIYVLIVWIVEKFVYYLSQIHCFDFTKKANFNQKNQIAGLTRKILIRV